ncbi:putative membrane protein [Rhodobium orientis]|uniref:von Hippel-Lindau disease tumour suppressor beta domain-containing protein n=1 Tax=Rhodobium orientis TaxID=34017 RepID=A0A327JJ25_9HYPH|nr:hypothetical protein [Rhodobium orientis]MBB4305243.1 putative membrane protein [Rhodobium orientis]MBK5952129.1 hypothetical protein [Rhodobium orientis]RAI26319.1 hypothetical protein CH339_14580 [Rhodobium orientis]
MTRVFSAALAGVLTAGLAGAMSFGAAGPASAASERFARLGDWVVFAVFRDGEFRACRARLRSRTAGALIFSYNGRIWRVGVPGTGSRTKVAGDLFVDDFSQFADFAGSRDGKRAATRVDDAFIDEVRAGRVFGVRLGGRERRWSLNGSAAALSAAEDCVAQNGGPARRPKLKRFEMPNARTAAPEPRAEPPVMRNAARSGAGCPAPGAMPSPSSDVRRQVRFTNRADQAVNIYWLDSGGTPVEFAALMPGETTTLDSFSGHRWIARDFQGRCHGGVMTVDDGGNRFTIR